MKWSILMGSSDLRNLKRIERIFYLLKLLNLMGINNLLCMCISKILSILQMVVIFRGTTLLCIIKTNVNISFKPKSVNSLGTKKIY